jgi:hypothetical protein
MKRPKADKRPRPKSPGIQAETISASDAQAEADRIAEAIVASAQMDQDAAYLTSGRRFKNLSEAKHSKKWIKSFRIFTESNTGREFYLALTPNL